MLFARSRKAHCEQNSSRTTSRGWKRRAMPPQRSDYLLSDNMVNASGAAWNFWSPQFAGEVKSECLLQHSTGSSC
jgi:hypothetical protein